MQEPPLLDMLNMQHHIAIPAAARRSHDILVERKRDEDDNNK